MKPVLQILLLVLALGANAQPARIILIRHAEKPDDAKEAHLSEEGRERARRLVKWICEGKVLGTNGAPVALYAAAPTLRGRSVRCSETLEPAARQLGLPVLTPRQADDYERFARALLRDKSLAGKNVVVCWVHDYLPALAKALGIDPEPPKWKGSDFETAYIITFPNGKADLEYGREKLQKKK
jgi:hypothetical protein